MTKDVVLSFDQFMVLHNVTLAWPHGLDVPADDPSIKYLAAIGFVKSTVMTTRWLPTEAGVHHILPEKSRANRGRALPESRAFH